MLTNNKKICYYIYKERIIDMITVNNYKDLKALRFHGEGETAYVKKDKCGYVYHDNKWVKIDTDGSGLKMNLYEINKSIYS